MKRPVYNYLGYEEVIRRMIDATALVEGPSCYPVSITFYAGNTVEPPVISCELMKLQSDGSTKTIYLVTVDQNTTYERFADEIQQLRKQTEMCAEARHLGKTYEELSAETSRGDQDQDLPF